MSNKLKAKPFIKWAGGKRSLINQLKKRIPKSFTGYYEPFVGGGILFYSISKKKSYLSDINYRLILTYQCIKNNPDKIVKNLLMHNLGHSKDYYIKCKNLFNKEVDPIKISSLFIYLNKTCFNGLYRVNRSGNFNVPMGNYKNPLIFDEKNLYNVSLMLKTTEIMQHSFEYTPIEKKGFYYLDPPYYKTFNQYTYDGFDEKSHERLAIFCEKINKMGAYFMLSYSDEKFIKNLYCNYYIENVSALHFISCKSHKREKKNEN